MSKASYSTYTKQLMKFKYWYAKRIVKGDVCRLPSLQKAIIHLKYYMVVYF